MMKTKLFKLSAVALLALFCFSANAQIETPAPSTAGSTSTKVGLTDVEINYFRPLLRGRKIFGAGDSYLQPFGQMWRAGANSGTKVKFSDDVKIGGDDLAAGEYLLLATPGASEWTIYFYTDVKMGGNLGGFKEDNVAAKLMVKPSKLTEPVSMLTYQITDLSEDAQNANIQLSWENTAVKIPFSVSFDKDITKSINGSLVSTATYYLSMDKNLEDALSLMNMYLADEKNAKQFWYVHVKAKILAKLGKKKEAKETATKSMELAKANEGGDFGYVKLNQDLISSL